MGFPIRTSTDQGSIGSSPWLIAAIHVLHRCHVPRHPPLALCSLDFKDARARYAILKERGGRLELGGGGPGDLGRHDRSVTGDRSWPGHRCGGRAELPQNRREEHWGPKPPGVRVINSVSSSDCARGGLLRKEVIQPHLPVRLPCYDFTPIADPTFGSSLPKGWATDFGCYRLSWCDGRCVQGPGTYSPRRC